jgi:hypothetical protein
MIEGGPTMIRLDMLNAREIFRLKQEVGLSLREIGPGISIFHYSFGFFPKLFVLLINFLFQYEF